MKTIISEVQKMLKASSTTPSNDVAASIIKHSLSHYRGMSFSDIETEDKSSSFVLSYKKINDVSGMLNMASDIAQQYGHLLTAISTDCSNNVAISVSPISESNIDMISLLGDCDLDKYGDLHIEMPAQYDDCYLLNVVGEFTSGTTFDDFIEKISDHVVDSNYHYSHECYDDVVTIAIYCDEVA